MFEFLTGIIQVFVNIFQAIQSIFSGVVSFVAWFGSLAMNNVENLQKVTSLIPYQVFVIAIPLLCVAIAAAFLRAASWIKHMLPFN